MVCTPCRVFSFQAEDVIRYEGVTGVQTCALFFQAEDGIRDESVTGVQTCALPIQAEDGIRDESVTGVQTCGSEEHTSELQSHSHLVCRLLEFRRVLRSEEHTSELQSHSHLVCRLLLKKKKNTYELQSNMCSSDLNRRRQTERECALGGSRT